MSSLSKWIQRRVERFVVAQRNKPNAVRVLAEGDSWLTHGGWMWGGMSLIEQLNRYQTVNIVSLAQPGAELQEMVEPRNRQWLLACNPDWLKGETYDVVLLSGGGNDVVGRELTRLLFDRSQNRRGGEQINDVELDATFRGMHGYLSSIRQTVDRLLGTGAPVLMHGYDYALPSGRPFEMLGGLITVGPWIKSSLVSKGIVDDGEQREVVNALIDRFNEFLHAQQADIDHFLHLDLRGTLKADQWSDELHPTAEGRQELAKIVRARLVEAIGS